MPKEYKLDQTHFASEGALWGEPELAAPPQEILEKKKKSSKKFLIIILFFIFFIVIIILLLSLISMRKKMDNDKNSLEETEETMAKEIEQDQLIQNIQDLKTLLKEADPAKNEDPFPAINSKIYLDEPRISD
ncbi:MAG: hypothetical protein PVJ09_04890 [Candidatus Woesebacteria bacterium]|jgi:predicted PurR-regulated permease PerM